jgi:hypothetical protein
MEKMLEILYEAHETKNLQFLKKIEILKFIEFCALFRQFPAFFPFFEDI